MMPVHFYGSVEHDPKDNGDFSKPCKWTNTQVILLFISAIKLLYLAVIKFRD